MIGLCAEAFDPTVRIIVEEEGTVRRKLGIDVRAARDVAQVELLGVGSADPTHTKTPVFNDFSLLEWRPGEALMTHGVCLQAARLLRPRSGVGPMNPRHHAEPFVRIGIKK